MFGSRSSHRVTEQLPGINGQGSHFDLATDLRLLAVLVLGAASLWSAIPIGLALGLDPWAACVAAAIGAALGTLAVSAVGDRI